MIQSMLTKESPEIIRFFRNIDRLAKILDTQAEKTGWKLLMDNPTYSQKPDMFN